MTITYCDYIRLNLYFRRPLLIFHQTPLTELNMKILRYFLPIAIVLLSIIHPAIAQKKFSGSTTSRMDALLEWTSILEKEYPEENFNQISIGKLRQYYIHLFADKFFVPVFGTPYLDMEYKRIQQIDKQLNECLSDAKQAHRLTWQKQLLSAFKNDYTAYDYGSTYKYAQNRKNLRNSYDALIKQLSVSPGTSFIGYTLYDLGQLERGTFYSLLPSDKRTLKACITTHADSMLKKSLPHFLNLSATYTSAVHIYRYLDTSTVLFNLTSPNTKQACVTILNNRIEEILQPIMREETGKFNIPQSSEADFEKGNKFSRSFKSNYRELLEVAVIKNTLNNFYANKTLAIKNILPELQEKVNNAKSFKPLIEIEALYLEEANKEDEIIKHLQAAVINRENELIKLSKIENERVFKDTKYFDALPLRVDVINAFKVAYNGDFLALHRFELENKYIPGLEERYVKADNQSGHVPYSMFLGAIRAISAKYGKQIEANAVSLEYYSRKYVGTDKSSDFFRTTVTHNYKWERGLTLIVEKPLLETFHIACQKRREILGISSHEGDVPVAYFITDNTEHYYKGFQYLIENYGYSHDVMQTTLANLYKFINNNWDTKRPGGYKYIDEEIHKARLPLTTWRHYYKVPHGFAPPLTVPFRGADVMRIVVHHDAPKTTGIAEVQVELLGYGASSRFFYPEKNIPSFIIEAKNRRKFYVVTITHNVSENNAITQKESINWYGDGLLPPEEIQEYFKGKIGGVVNEALKE